MGEQARFGVFTKSSRLIKLFDKKMNDHFLRATGGLAVSVFVVAFVAAIVVTHVSYVIAKRRGATSLYLAFMDQWFLRRAVLVVFMVTALAMLLAIVPATALAWYRTRSLHQLADGQLVLRIHKLNRPTWYTGCPQLSPTLRAQLIRLS